MDSFLEKINSMILEDKETLSVLPQNNKKNIEEYLKYLEQNRNKYRRLKKQVVMEIKDRYNKIIRKYVKLEVKQLEKNIKSYENLFLLDDKISSYEKMGLDIISYNLNRFYKTDLNFINKHIFDCIMNFKKCNIKLDAKDFNYNQYTFNYMSVFFEELDNNPVSSERLKSIFEEIYWKCPDIMKYINLNIYYLYYKNQKEIDRYFRNEKDKLITKFRLKPEQIIEQYQNLKEQYFKKYNQDEAILLHKFVYQDYDINRYTDNEIKAEYSKIVKLDLEKISKQKLENLNSNIYQLHNSLYEYKNYLNYQYIIDDMKKRNAVNSKIEYSIEKDLKKISVEEKKLMKLNAKIAKSSGKSLDENIEKSESQLVVLKELYEKLEEAIINSEIRKMFNENYTIYQLLLYASSHYSYFCKCLVKNKIKQDEEDINKDEQFADLKEFLVNPQFNVLIKNIKVNEDKNIEQIIKDRYFLFNIEIKEEDLKLENLDSIISVIDKIVLYNNIKNSELTVKDIKFMCDLKRVIQK